MKLVLHALHENNVPFINAGQPVNVVEIGTTQSLVAIIVILVATVLVSMLSAKGKAKLAVGRLRRVLAEYLELDADATPARRAEVYARLVAAEAVVLALPAELRALIHERQSLREMLADAHAR